MSKNEHIPVTLKEALDLHHGRIKHLHWTSPTKDKGGTVMGMQHHHLLYEFGLKTGVYSTSKTARDDLANLLVGYYPQLQGSLVSFGGRRGFNIRSEISIEERKVRERLAKAEESDGAKGKKQRRAGRGGEPEAVAATA